MSYIRCANRIRLPTNQPPSGREGDHGSGGRSPRSLGITINKRSVIDSMRNIYRRLILTTAQINDIIKM